MTTNQGQKSTPKIAVRKMTKMSLPQEQRCDHSLPSSATRLKLRDVGNCVCVNLYHHRGQQVVDSGYKSCEKTIRKIM